MGLFAKLRRFLFPGPNDPVPDVEWYLRSKLDDLHRASRYVDGTVPHHLLGDAGIRTVESRDGLTAFVTTNGGRRHVEVGLPRLLELADLGVAEDDLVIETTIDVADDGAETHTTVGHDRHGNEVFRRSVRHTVSGTPLRTTGQEELDEVIRHVIDDLHGDRHLVGSPVADALAAFLDRHPAAKVVDDHIGIDLADDESEEAIVEEMAEAVRLVEAPPAPVVPDEPPAPPAPPADAADDALDLTEAGVLAVVFDTSVGAYERSTTVAERYVGQTVAWDAVVERTSTLGGRTEIHALLGHLTEAARYSDRGRATIRTDEVVDLERDTTIRFTAEIDGIDVYTRRITLVNARLD